MPGHGGSCIRHRSAYFQEDRKEVHSLRLRNNHARKREHQRSGNRIRACGRFIKENHDSIWDKYAVKNPAALNGRINVDYLEERDVMPINPTFNPSDSDILSPDSAK